MLLAQFILHITFTYAATCNARHRQGGSTSNKGTVQQQEGGQPAGAAVVAPAPSAVSSSPVQSSSVAAVPGGSGSATGQTGDQTNGATGGQQSGQTSGQQNVTQSGQQPGSGSTGQTGQGRSKSAAQQVGSGSNNLVQVDGAVSSSSTTPAPPAASSSAPAPAASISSSTNGGTTSSASTSGGKTASFTQYGAGDTFGSGNCNAASAACGWYSNPGYNAAASQALFGVGPGGGAGPACGQCFKLSPVGEGTNSIVVKVNNLCPASGNPLCAAAADVDVNFDLCKDDGAAKALFGSSPTGQVNGTYAPVDCSEWSGSANIH